MSRRGAQKVGSECVMQGHGPNGKWWMIPQLTWSRRRVWWNRRGRKWPRTPGRSGTVAGVCCVERQRGGVEMRMEPALHFDCCHRASLPASFQQLLRRVIQNSFRCVRPVYEGANVTEGKTQGMYMKGLCPSHGKRKKTLFQLSTSRGEQKVCYGLCDERFKD